MAAVARSTVLGATESTSAPRTARKTHHHIIPTLADFRPMAKRAPLYCPPMRPLCVFDLDHTLVRSPLDLVAVKAEIRALAVGRGLALPERSRTWTIGETIAGIAMRAAELEAACWAIC